MSTTDQPQPQPTPEPQPSDPNDPRRQGEDPELPDQDEGGEDDSYTDENDPGATA